MDMSLPATLRHEGEKLFIDYEAASLGTGYVAPSVMLEFGARATGEPASLRVITFCPLNTALQIGGTRDLLTWR